MHGEIDQAGEQRLFDLLGKETLAALLPERPVGDAVSAGLDQYDLVGAFRELVRLGQSGDDLACLRQCQRRAACANADLASLQAALSWC